MDDTSCAVIEISQISRVVRWMLLDKRHIANYSAYRLDRKDSEVSPGTVLPKPVPSNARGYIAPWESDDTPSPNTQLNNYSNIPSINRQPPSALSPWSATEDKEMQMPTSVFGRSFYNDSNENLSQVSPGFAPPGGMGFPIDGEDRRPSIASATTVSSQGSKGSIGGKYRKKLQGFFGEEFAHPNESSSRQNSEASSLKGVLPAFAPGGSRNRNISIDDGMLVSGPPSPGSSRPRTPAHGPNSEVTPWVFQDPQVGSRWMRRLPFLSQKA